MMQIPLANFVATLERILDWHNIDDRHGQRTAAIAVAIGKRVDVTGEGLFMLDYAARIHDLGRVGIDNHVLSKSGRLTAAQRAAVEAHPRIGFDLLTDSGLPHEITMTILHHHEHWDGSGYPRGLKGLDIPLFARIVCVADTWDALTSKRPYRPMLSNAEALIEMDKVMHWFDPKLFALFLSILEDANGRF